VAPAQRRDLGNPCERRTSNVDAVTVDRRTGLVARLRVALRLA